jgi:very-short-patch-repair endonuclease
MSASDRGIFINYMRRYYKNFLKDNSRRLRKEMTKAEIILWNRIRKKQVNNLQFNRQKPLGNYIVDFYCPVKKLIIEIDGGQHYDSGKLIKKDTDRENFLTNVLKLKVIRFTNDDILQNLASVMDKIIENLR